MSFDSLNLPIQYTYLLGACLFIIPWAILFYHRRDLRQILIHLGLIAIPLGLIAEYFWWTNDWWQPYTITGTTIGVEDAILSFTSAGVAATLYLAVFRKRLEQPTNQSRQRLLYFACIVVATLLLFGLLFQFGINSFIATLITFTAASAVFVVINNQLFWPSLVSGILTTLLVIPIYLIMIWLTPTFVEETWIVENMIGQYFLGVPLEDYAFYFAAGMLSFCAYPFLTNASITSLKQTHSNRV